MLLFKPSVEKKKWIRYVYSLIIKKKENTNTEHSDL